jgi:hypothetical protein
MGAAEVDAGGAAAEPEGPPPHDAQTSAARSPIITFIMGIPAPFRVGQSRT